MEKLEPIMDQENLHHKETTSIDGKIYHNFKLREYGEKNLPIIQLDTDKLAPEIDEGHRYWEAQGIEPFGPADLVKMTVEERQSNPAYQEHWEKILKSDLNDPIFVTEEGAVFDGVHRLTRAALEKKDKIKVRVFTKEDLLRCHSEESRPKVADDVRI